MIRRIKTIDAHTAGEPLRLIVEGFPSPPGATMRDKQAWVRRRRDRVRRALMREPRGHADMYGAVLTEPVSPDAHAGVLFMHNAGYSSMCGHGIIAVATIALERGVMHPSDPGDDLLFDTPAGTVRARAAVRTVDASDRRQGGRRLRVDRVSYSGIPSFVLKAGLSIDLGTRVIKADVAFGGAFYAIVDAEAVGVAIRREQLPDLRALAMQIKRTVERAVTVEHPVEAGLSGVYGTVFTGVPDGEGADLRNVSVFADGQVDRSPCGTGTAAVMAVLDAMGLLSDERPFVHESIIGTQFSGTVDARTRVGEHAAVVPRIEGRAWVTGEHEFMIDDEDPLREGIAL